MERKVIDQKEYLKKYLSSGNGEDNKKKKKKKVKSKATVKIIDDDLDLKNMRPIEDNEFDIFIHGEDAPLIVGVVDERGPVDFSDKRRWKIMAADEGGDLTVTSREIKQSKKVQNDSVDNLSPARKEICSNDDLSPPRISEKQKKKSRKDEDNDLSPPRVKSKKHISSKRQTAESNIDSNESQEKDIAVHKSKKKAKRKGKTSDDSDLSPPRKAKNCDSDFSPPRKSRKHKSNNRNESDSDLSPPRKTKNYDSDLSPPRKSKKHKSNNRNQSDSDLSPPRKSRKESDSDLSPRRRNKKNSNSDLSPLRNRRTKNYDSDLSPPRKSKKHKQKTKDSNSDLSPPRRRHEKDTNVHASYRRRDRNDQSDFSPPIKHKHRDERSERSRSYKHSEKNSKSDRRWNDSDMNPPRRMHRDVDTSSSSFREGGRDRSKSHKTNYRYDDDSNRLPREDSYDRKSTQKDSDETDSDKRMKKTLDGKKAGLQGARELREEIEAHKKREAEHFKMLSKEVTGAGQAAVVRDTKTGRKRDLEAEAAEKRERQKRQAELDAKYAKWGKGLKQVEDHDDKLKDDLYEMTKPLARYADDADLDKRLRDQDREGDPMLEYIKQKQIKEGKREADRPTYEGSFMPNRFGIKPGCRWDGVDRSNGYEKKWFDAQNAKVALQEEAYKWSTSDM